MIELLACSADCRKYKLVSSKNSYQYVCKILLRFGKKIDVQVRLHDFSGGDPIVVLRFLPKLDDAGNLNLFPESFAVYCFQFYVEQRAVSLLATRPTGSSMAVDSKTSEEVRTKKTVVKFLLQTYGTDEATGKAHSDAVHLRRNSAMTRNTDFGML